MGGPSPNPIAEEATPLAPPIHSSSLPRTNPTDDHGNERPIKSDLAAESAPTSISSLEHPSRPSSSDPPSGSPGIGKTGRPTKKSTVQELRVGLENLGLDSKGKKETLWRRLIHAFNRTLSLDASSSDLPTSTTEQVVSSKPQTETDQNSNPFVTVSSRRRYNDNSSSSNDCENPEDRYQSFLCFDVEATCEAGKNFAYPNEIIEFPVVLLRWVDEPSLSSAGALKTPGPLNGSAHLIGSTLPVKGTSRRKLIKIDTFHTYVRPTWRPKLSDFCTGLTGITQEMVDASPTFPEVLARLETWLDKWELREGNRLKRALWVTDGPWDLRDFIPKQLFITPTKPKYPAYLLGEYLNLKQAVQSVLTEQWRRDQIDLQRSGKGPVISRNPEILSFDDEDGPSPALKTSASSSQSDDKDRETPLTPSKHGQQTHPTTETEPVESSQLMDGTPKSIMQDKPWGRMTTGRGERREAGRATVGPNFYRTIDGQLEALGLGKFEGRQHSGLDDATNISRILIALSEMGVIIEPNARLPPAANSKRFPWMGNRPGEIVYDTPQAEVTGNMGPLQVSGSSSAVAADQVNQDEDDVIKGRS